MSRTKSLPARRTVSRAVAAVSSALAALCLAGVAFADDAQGPRTLLHSGDLAGARKALEDGYRKGTLDVWGARLYQDLRIEAGERAALVEETKAAFPEPRSPLGQYLLARLAPRKDADAALSKVQAAAPDALAVLLDLGWVALDTDRLPRAITCLDKAKRAADGREEVALFEARLLEARGDRADAERALAQYVAAHPDAVEARCLWAEVLLARRRAADAVAVLEEALARSKPTPVLVMRAEVAVRRREFDAAKAALEQAGQGGRPSLRARAHALKSAIALARRDEKTADAEAEAALAASPVSAWALRAKARALEAAGKYREAVSRLDAAIAERPFWAALLVDKGHVLRRMGEARDAKKAFSEAKKRDPDDLDAVVGLGLLSEDEGEWAPAERAYKTVLKADPDHLEARRLLSGVYFSMGRLDDANEEAAWIRERFPKDPEPWAMAGRVYLKQDRFDDALAMFQKAVEVDPSYAIAHMGLGWVLEEQSKPEEATKAYEAAIAADPKLPLPHRYLAELLEERNDPKGALAHYRAYLDLGGDDPDEDVKHAVERLGK